MSKIRRLSSFRTESLFPALLSVFALLCFVSPFVAAQSASEPPEIPDAPGIHDAGVPDAGTSSSRDLWPAETTGVPAGEQEHGLRYRLSHSDSIVFPNETRAPLTPRQKVVLGLEGSVSPFAMTGWLASSGWSQLRNSQPNYGTDRGAYGQRLGATALRNISQDVFGGAVLAPLLHEDPRYYELGSGHNFFKRGVYAVSRVFITRSDTGHATPNFALIGGNLAGVSLANAYYPPLNRGFRQTAMGFGTSLGGSAIGCALSEFYEDALRIAHLK